MSKNQIDRIAGRKQTEYKQGLFRRYWAYQQNAFPDVEMYFDLTKINSVNPPVFLRAQAHHNVLVNPAANQAERDRLLQTLPAVERHKWFGSMNSSQALAQSVLGNLAIYDLLGGLADLKDEDDKKPLFGDANVSATNFAMEQKVKYLGEPRPTSLDAFVSGPYQVAIECKFTEPDVGACSRPGLRESASNYATDRCDGSYSVQLARTERCSLTESKVLYWKYAPALFDWNSATDIPICPMNKSYQLVRNVLAACVRNGTAAPQNGHAVLIYDARNPAFQPRGNGWHAFDETRKALKDPTRLRRCSWQTMINHLKYSDLLPWLTTQLDEKYGLR